MTTSPPAFDVGCSTIALDVGGTEIKGAIRSVDGTVTSLQRWPSEREAGPDATVAAVDRVVAELLAAAPEVQAIGLVVPGTVDETAGIAIHSENIGWYDNPFRERVARNTGLPVGFGHDVRAGGLAERTFGAARGSDNVLFMPIGTGISGAMVVEGHAISGGYRGEIGHLDVGSGLTCACGMTGCLETVATGPSIARDYEARTGVSVDGAKPVVERMLAGDADAAQVWARAIDALAHALTSYITLLAPDTIVVGGGISAAGDALLLPLTSAVESRLVWQQMPRILPAALGDLAGNVGAHILAGQAFAQLRENGRNA